MQGAAAAAEEEEEEEAAAAAAAAAAAEVLHELYISLVHCCLIDRSMVALET